MRDYFLIRSGIGISSSADPIFVDLGRQAVRNERELFPVRGVGGQTDEKGSEGELALISSGMPWEEVQVAVLITNDSDWAEPVRIGARRRESPVDILNHISSTAGN